jgi:sterol desaturase/sphingolipid hydroxylase (fatty acid hydroxylase superfamily)
VWFAVTINFIISQTSSAQYYAASFSEESDDRLTILSFIMSRLHACHHTANSSQPASSYSAQRAHSLAASSQAAGL